MTWANFYLVCFLIGFLLSLASLLLGSLHLHIHLSHGGGNGLHFHFHGHGAAHVAGHAAGHLVHGAGHVSSGAGHHGGIQHGAGEAEVSPINFGTIAAFLTWFGGAGYLLTRFSGVGTLLGIGIAILFGLVGGGIVFWFLLKLVSHEENLDPFDYEMTGVLGRVSSGICAGGTGEIIYSQGGTRRTAGARSEDGSQIRKGTEVVVTRYEKGIAYVRRWDELAGETRAAEAASEEKQG